MVRLSFYLHHYIIPILGVDKELFRKGREIQNKITELLGIKNAQDFVEATLDDRDEFNMVDLPQKYQLCQR